MAGMLLFCVSEEAKAFVRDILDTRDDDRAAEAGKKPGIFHLVESRDRPPPGQRLRKQLQKNESFTTDFIDATPEECQQWNDEWCLHDRAPLGVLIAIADARSAQDGTLLIQKHVQPPEGTEDFIFGGYGVLPPETNVWYDFRVEPRHAREVVAALCFTAPNVTFPFWYGNKERFTDENGVFDVQECRRYCGAKDPDVVESEIYKRVFRNAPGYDTTYGPEPEA